MLSPLKRTERAVTVDALVAGRNRRRDTDFLPSDPLEYEVPSFGPFLVAMNRIVTLTTDFGTGSGYVAEMKGRLLHAAAPITLIDLSHDVPPHDIRAAAWLVGQAFDAFPAGTLHVVVVDPGVGTSRLLLWARVGKQEFICPDNGVLSWAATKATVTEARQLTTLDGASATFHGRDVIAPAAVRLLDGGSPESLGPLATDFVMLQWPVPRETESAVLGEVLHVDAFGNLVTNLPASLLPRLTRHGMMHVGPHAIATVVRTYGDASPGAAVALVGSQGFLEIGVVEGRADSRFSARPGTPVTLP
ncbi:MAG: S-adenosyl-l-methionine hydroxide adenosyltransferase family protein [Planctomycetia bacterium]